MAGRKPQRRPAVDPGFAALLADVKGRIQAAQTRAVLAVNAELVRALLGHRPDHRRAPAAAKAGARPLFRGLALELKNELPELKGFSERNIRLMLAFYREYPDPAEFVQPAVTIAGGLEIAANLGANCLPAVSAATAARLSAALWSDPVGPPRRILIEKVKDLPTRRWYMEQTLANGWSRNVLALQIDARAHARHGKAVSNFAALLPAPQSDLAQQTLKDPYIFDFLTLDRAVPRARTGDRTRPTSGEVPARTRPGLRLRRPAVPARRRRRGLLHRPALLPPAAAGVRRHRPEEGQVQARVRRQAELLLQRRQRPAQARDRRPDHRADPLPDAGTSCSPSTASPASTSRSASRPTN